MNCTSPTPVTLLCSALLAGRDRWQRHRNSKAIWSRVTRHRNSQVPLLQCPGNYSARSQFSWLQMENKVRSSCFVFCYSTSHCSCSYGQCSAARRPSSLTKPFDTMRCPFDPENHVTCRGLSACKDRNLDRRLWHLGLQVPQLFTHDPEHHCPTLQSKYPTTTTADVSSASKYNNIMY